MGVRRQVAWPRDAAAVAHSLARAGAWFWLDGEAVEPNGSRGRSFLGEAAEVRWARRGAEREFIDGLRAADRADWVAALSYELGVALMGLDPLPDEADPGFALRVGTVLVLDHEAGLAELRGPDEGAVDDWLARHGGALEAGVAEMQDPSERAGGSESSEPVPSESAPGMATWRKSRAAYEAEVEACRAAIREGDAYVLCLTDTAEASGDFDPLLVYRRLREATQHSAVRGAVIVAGERALVSSSPERFLSVRDGRVSTHPIKGTRPRGRDPEEDANLARDLAADPKERAENLMIVDLMRNDLSRVCVPGTVAAEEFQRVESHPAVHQLVSTVSGRIAPDLDLFHVLEACFPGGSMTGAPKRSAVEILASLEGAPRGLYSGCFGRIEGGGLGAAELAMTIRSVELRGVGTGNVHARVGAGGGVTIDSDPAKEFAEKDLKAARLLAALGDEHARSTHSAER